MTLPAPSPDLRACVVVPARDEEELVSACLQALAAQEDVGHQEYEVLLVLDACADSTEARALEVATVNPALRLYFLDGPGIGSGHARRVGMDAACARLNSSGRPDGLIASTDADTIVASDWLSAQLDAVASGAKAIGGRIDLPVDGSVPQHLLDWHAERGRRRLHKLLSEPDRVGRTEHWQFSGASLAITAEVYGEVGGLEPLPVLEDEGLERVLVQHGIPVERLRSVRAMTSGRLVGRAGRGLAHDLSRVILERGKRATR